jgi:hypothetical protein
MQVLQAKYNRKKFYFKETEFFARGKKSAREITPGRKANIV